MKTLLDIYKSAAAFALETIGEGHKPKGDKEFDKRQNDRAVADGVSSEDLWQWKEFFRQQRGVFASLDSHPSQAALSERSKPKSKA